MFITITITMISMNMLIRIKPECVELVMEKTAVGDWFLLYLLGQNIDHIVFKVIRMRIIDEERPKVESKAFKASRTKMSSHTLIMETKN